MTIENISKVHVQFISPIKKVATPPESPSRVTTPRDTLWERLSSGNDTPTRQRTQSVDLTESNAEPSSSIETFINEIRQETHKFLNDILVMEVNKTLTSYKLVVKHPQEYTFRDAKGKCKSPLIVANDILNVINQEPEPGSSEETREKLLESIVVFLESNGLSFFPLETP